jgi:hypothetical protein
MRKNVKETYDKWKRQQNRTLKNDSTSTDGTCLYSYHTAILKWIAPGAVAILNRTYYSKTTSSQQNSLRSLLRHDEIIFEETSEEGFKNWRADAP